MEHHAYVYEGSQTLLESLFQDARKILKFNQEQDPDVRVQSYEKFGIDDATALKTSSSYKTISGRALYVIGIGSITTEAQQALLKLFEEPPRRVIFVLLVPHGTLIATLQSRTLPYPHKLETEKKGSSAKKFLSESINVRSAAVAALLNDEEGQKERVRDFLSELEFELYSRHLNSKTIIEVREGLEDIAKIRSYISDRSPSLKMLLEHLAISLPIF